jgi:hypothetical protein
MVGRIRNRLPVSKRETRKFDTDGSNLKKLDHGEAELQQVNISSRSAGKLG